MNPQETNSQGFNATVDLCNVLLPSWLAGPGTSWYKMELAGVSGWSHAIYMMQICFSKSAFEVLTPTKRV